MTRAFSTHPLLWMSLSFEPSQDTFFCLFRLVPLFARLAICHGLIDCIYTHIYMYICIYHGVISPWPGDQARVSI